MKSLNNLSLLYRQYQTRKQLQQLPAHLLHDIAVTKEMRNIELQKNRTLPLFFSILDYLVKAG
tara:strand:+ start:24110 stop:24298 length:189 start_codon:yes stop_codon:yes gene_type:complete